MGLFGFISFEDTHDGGGRGGSGSDYSLLTHDEYVADYRIRNGHDDPNAHSSSSTSGTSSGSNLPGGGISQETRDEIERALYEANGIDVAAHLSLAAYEQVEQDIPAPIREKYDIEIVERGRDAYTIFTDLETGQVTIAVRGTAADNLSETDWPSNIVDNGLGIPIDLSREIAAVSDRSFAESGQQVIIVGHSRGGGIAEQAARLSPESIGSVVNVQGPSVVEVAFGVIPTPLGVVTEINLNNGIPLVEVTRITASEYDPVARGLAQFF